MKKLFTVVLVLSIAFSGLFADASETADAVAKEIAEGVATTTLGVAKEGADIAIEAAQEVEFPTGTWVDENWNAEWVMDVAKVHIYDATNGELVYTFTKQNTENFKFVPTSKGISLSFTCAETNRSYKITKDLNLSSDLILEIDPNWTDTDYKVNLKFKSVNIPNYAK